MMTTLLDHLARGCGISCLSDLRNSEHRPALLDLVSRTEAASYPAKDWREALLYIFNAPDEGGGADALRHALLDRLGA